MNGVRDKVFAFRMQMLYSWERPHSTINQVIKIPVTAHCYVIHKDTCMFMWLCFPVFICWNQLSAKWQLKEWWSPQEETTKQMHSRCLSRFAFLYRPVAKLVSAFSKMFLCNLHIWQHHKQTRKWQKLLTFSESHTNHRLFLRWWEGVVLLLTAWPSLMTPPHFSTQIENVLVIYLLVHPKLTK